jgi:uncharacterized protein (DUF433 family)
MSYEDRITIDPAIRGGKPCIKGTRITVYDILEYLAGDMSEDEILQDFPSLSRQDLRATLEFAAARERMLAVSTDEWNFFSMEIWVRDSSLSLQGSFHFARTLKC